jgi:hypothetical protein
LSTLGQFVKVVVVMALGLAIDLHGADFRVSVEMGQGLCCHQWFSDTSGFRDGRSAGPS